MRIGFLKPYDRIHIIISWNSAVTRKRVVFATIASNYFVEAPWKRAEAKYSKVCIILLLLFPNSQSQNYTSLHHTRDCGHISSNIFYGGKFLGKQNLDVIFYYSICALPYSHTIHYRLTVSSSYFPWQYCSFLFCNILYYNNNCKSAVPCVPAFLFVFI